MFRNSVTPALFLAVAVTLTACGSLGTASDSSKKVNKAIKSGSRQSAPASVVGQAGSTASSTPSPDPLAAAVTKSGTGDAIVKLKGGLDEARILTTTHAGSANFVVQTLDAKGANLDLLVNTIGSYKGTVLLVPDATVSAVRITADGAWTFQLRDVRAAQKWSATKPVSGTGDQVLIIPGGTSALTTVKITNSGEGNFVVNDTDSKDHNLLVNEIGHWSGTEALPDGTVAVDIISDGRWSITPTA